MSKMELLAKIELLNRYEAMMEEIKAEMMARNIEELSVCQFIVRWTSILSNRFDTTGFKKAYGDLYKQYTKHPSAPRRREPSGASR